MTTKAGTNRGMGGGGIDRDDAGYGTRERRPIDLVNLHKEGEKEKEEGRGASFPSCPLHSRLFGVLTS